MIREIAKIPLERVVPFGGGRIYERGGEAILVTTPGRWHYAGEAAFEIPGISDENRVLRIRLAVEYGSVGVGWLNTDGTDWVARVISDSGPRATDLDLEIPRGTVGGKLVFENASESGLPSVAVIDSIAIGESRSAAIQALFNKDNWYDLPTEGQALEELEAYAREFDSLDDLLKLVPDRLAFRNLAKSVWEYVKGKTSLSAYPWNVTIPVADLCNARCTFCTSWLDGRKILDLDELDRFEGVLRHALKIGLVGHGEPLAHPRFDELCDRLAQIRDPASYVYTITNGFFLEKWRDRLDKINLGAISVSLNAATAETHDAVMGLGPDAFPRIVDSIKYLIDQSASTGNKRFVHATLVVTQQNLHEIPAFVELGNRLGVSSIWFRVLLPQAGLIPGLNYHLVPPYLHPDFDRLHRSAVAAIQASEVPVNAEPGVWGQRIFTQALEQEIRLRPPPTISREDALRDRNLRHRNEFLYKQEQGIFRGRPVQDATNSKVAWAAGRLTIVTPKGPGAYAADVPVTYPSDGGGEVTVEVDAVCEDGVLGIGLLDEARNVWLDVARLEPGADQPVALRAAADGQTMRLVIHNGGDGVPARGSVGAVRIKVADIGQSLPLEWGLLRIHNAADLLDDGTNPLGRHPRFACKAVYYNLYINEFFYRMNPCCYLQNVPEFEEVRLDGDMTFMEGWNSPGMVELRRRLIEGPLYGACMRCPEIW